MTKLHNRTCDFHIRMSEHERAQLDAVAKNCGMTRSDLVRLLAKLPAEEISEGNIHLIAVDGSTLARIHREMRKFGTNFNQAVHALNSINFYLRNGSLRYEFLDLALPEITERLERIETQQADLCKEMSSLESTMLVSW